MRSAEKYLSQGKIRAAISEYKQIVENDPKDFSTLNMLGDLYVKNADKKEAVSCFTRVAEYYGKQGFTQKAIAVYNKILRLQPDSADVVEKLAELYQSKGSLAEARAHYTSLAEQFERGGKKIEALSIWKKIAELDPKNTKVYLKIAESFLQENQTEEAADAFMTGGARLTEQGDFEAALKAYSRALEIKEGDLKALNGFVKTQISLGYTDEAAKTLEQILVEQPFNRDILYLLVDCHLDTDNPQEAEKAIIKLVEQEPANYPKFLRLIEAYLKHNDLESGARILSMSSEHLLVGGQSEEFLRWTIEILARNPEQLEAARLLVRYYGWQRDESELKKSLERLAEVARLSESVDDERYALSQLVMMAPHEVGFAQRLQGINSQYDFSESDYESPVIAQPVAEIENSAGETPDFADYSTFHGEEAVEAAPQFAAEGFGDFQNGFASANDLNGAGEKDFAFVTETFEAKIVEDFNEDEYASFEKSDDLFDPGFVEMEENAGDAKISAADELRLEKELESIEFYIAQEYFELAEKSIKELEAEFGSRPEFAALREQMNYPSAAPAEEALPQVEFAAESLSSGGFSAASFEIVSEKVSEDYSIVNFDQGNSNGNGAQNYDFLKDFKDELGFAENESANAEEDYETHYHMAIAYKEMGLMEESIREFQDAINLVSPSDGTRRFFACAHLLGHCFMEKQMPNLALMWYKRALETANLTDEEKQGIWYEIGNAYEAGGDSEKALENFEMIYALNVDYRDVGERIQNLHVNG